MATKDQIQQHTARRPFAPFWIKLVSGETIFIMEPFRAVAMPKELAFTPDGRQMRHVPLEHIAAHGLLNTDRTSSTGDAP